MKTSNVIEINGKLYDAKSGKLLKGAAAKPKAPGHSMDGMTKTHTELKQATVHSSQSKATHTRTHSKAKLSAKRSTTLNRRAVSLPAIHAASIATTNEATEIPTTPQSTALKHADTKRIKRAADINRSPAISRFSSFSQNISPEHTEVPLSDHLARTHEEAPAKHMPANGKKARIISQAGSKALKSQTAGPLKSHKKRGKHITRYATGVFAALVLVGYVAYLNIPAISMKIAAHQAGFGATMPAYKPAGYSFSGPITSSPGKVSLSYASNTDNRNFTLSQQPTTWDSGALLENVVVKKSQNYLTYQDRGLTIYIYNGSNAAWVNNGKLYQVEGKNSNLDTDQLLKLATSV